ncbi:MAG: hypothetical protein JNL62_21750, partial [Bryobacterales bacterium]|nr:hypothetical protein [Bryobacterales bacterium]
MLLIASVSGDAQNSVRGQTRNPHGPLKQACETCHATAAWKPLRANIEFDHSRDTHYPLRGLHQNVECSRCHVNKVFTDVGKTCANCHADFHRRQMGGQCEDCHTVRGWKLTTQSDAKAHLNRFPLIGAHAAVNCESCHRGAASGVFKGLNTECVTCHLNIYETSVTVNHRRAGFTTDCKNCHTLDTWRNAKFNHESFTGYALTGRHTALECNSCHNTLQYKGTPANCFSCHTADYTAAKIPNHAEANFPRDCAFCHATQTWQGAKFDHNTTTKFPLTGAHAGIGNCASCHAAGRFTGTPMNCSGCHMPDFEKSTNPNHARGRFSNTCEDCHATVQWKGAKFDHKLARFTLTGAHTRTDCAQCHVGGKWTGTTTECAECHRTDFAKPTNPSHTAGGFPQNCTMCHTTAQWSGAEFNHNTSTKFALTGKHTVTTCAQCHVNDRFAGTGQECSSCHLDLFRSASNPNHLTGGFPSECTMCHATAAWKGVTFRHETSTRFALTGKHASASCQQCHGNNQFAGTTMQCMGCHRSEFQKTTEPNHLAARFAEDCATCHTTSVWKGAKFDHSSATKFALTGKHTAVTCQQCHVNDKFAGLGQDCATCHLDEFQKTKTPNHTAAGFASACQNCHSTTWWTGAKFDHNASTKFALTGKHTATTCQQCHLNDKFAGLGQDCVTCHRPELDRTANPNHAKAGFPSNCTMCHTTVQWTGAKFDHNTSTKFALTGKHTAATCQQCHTNERYAGIGQECATCHLDEFRNTKTPNHTNAGFATACQNCHSTLQWKGGTFDHSKTRFPLTGKHIVTTCQQCHTNDRFSGTAQTCIGCHQADFRKPSNNPNHVTAGFPEDCTMCHSTAIWKGARFDHNTATRYPLTGRHVYTTCLQCHVGNK